MTDLIISKLDNARRLLSEAKTLQETKNIVDIAATAEVYARRQQLGEEAIGHALEIKIYTLRKLREILEHQRARTVALQQAPGQILPWIFHRDGKPIKSFRRARLTACKRAGVPGRIPHDFRRTAARNLERAGVPRLTAMKMIGHKTESIYRRYAIVDEAMLREGAEKLSAFHGAERQGRPLNKAAGEK